MAWGYERCFTVEHDNTVKRRIDCKDCSYYESDDKSCMKRPLYLPEDGYNSWRNCQWFDLDKTISHYEEKHTQYIQKITKREKTQKQVMESNKAIEKKEQVVTKIKALQKEKNALAIKDEKTSKIFLSKKLKDGTKFCLVDKYPKEQRIKTELVKIKKGEAIKQIRIGWSLDEKKVYIDRNIYTKDAIGKVYWLLNEKIAGSKQR